MIEKQIEPESNRRHKETLSGSECFALSVISMPTRVYDVRALVNNPLVLKLKVQQAATLFPQVAVTVFLSILKLVLDLFWRSGAGGELQAEPAAGAELVQRAHRGCSTRLKQNLMLCVYFNLNIS